MKHLLTATVLIASALSAQAQTMIDTARVRSAQPQYETTRVPRQECTNRWESERGNRHSQGYQDQNQDTSRNYGGAVLGGLAGGVLGNQVGGGNGKVAATALGAVLGAFAGDNIGTRNAQPAPVYPTSRRGEEHCQTAYESQSQLNGYQVVYDYRGQTYSTFMRNNPGNSLRVRVSVEPIAE